MKIIDTDNFGGDYPNEEVIADNIKSEIFANVMCDALNHRNYYSDRFYKVVADDYQLVPGFKG